MCLFDLQGSSSPSRLLPSKMGQKHCPKISVTIFQPTQHTIPHGQNVNIKVFQLVDQGGKKKCFDLNYLFFCEVLLHHWLFCS